ncbi:tRNA lysidine(34) synthetase TilS [Noviherbaspirillum pedocola]|uniref:tRNA(Ile)-lysidine synthase n=1 Tax=Noviherbaspirillum pedocola TaxID=2801341 RepID=A0A934SSA4_9BURK|nr:tRNA lysidine(34) synthetase TilS [Noviherbaspirillum pedocola]MBK4735841.1 tRNA lysidine(34) synthetase TilS [Noviherbaspirillum pedocola]
MASSRKSRNPSNPSDIASAFERALGDILARVRALGRDPSRIAIAYSGGLDSSLLLHLACRYGKQNDIEIIACHVHHGLSLHADAWLAHCEAQALRLGAAFDWRRVALNLEGGHGVEEAARLERYRALAQMCERSGASLVLTGHHQDDQAETVLLQLMRGAGLPGLSGMGVFQERHALLGPKVALGRPLLGISRAALETAARAIALSHVDDESNADVRYRRNAVRHAVAPVLERHFPGYAAALSRSAAHAQSAQALLRDLAELDLGHCGASDWNAPLDANSLARLPARRADNLLRHWLQHQGVSLPSTARMDEMRAQMLNAASDAHPEIDFGGKVLRRVRGDLIIAARRDAPPQDDMLLRWQGEDEIAVPQWGGSLQFLRDEGCGIPIELLHEHGLLLRPRRGGERLKPARSRPSRSLKLLYQEAGIPPWRRLWSPLVYLNESLVFVAQLGMDARHAEEGGIVLRWRENQDGRYA